MRNRNIQCNIRLAESEAFKLNKICKITGLSQAAVIRSLITGKELKPKSPESYRELIRKVSGISNNVNQIAHQTNTVKNITPEQIEQVTALMKELWVLLKEGA